MHPDSPHYYPGTLGNQPVAVQFHAGSHYVALRLLSGYLPEEKLKLVHYGSPQFRFEALMNGDVAAAALMEPWITLAEKLGCRPVCEGHYLGAENASDNMDEETFSAINRAVAKAVDRINADKRKYLRYLIDEPRFAAVAAQHGGITPEDFHLPRLRYSYNTPYTDEIVEDTYHWMVRWGLLDGAACSADLVDNRLAEPGGSRRRLASSGAPTSHCERSAAISSGQRTPLRERDCHGATLLAMTTESPRRRRPARLTPNSAPGIPDGGNPALPFAQTSRGRYYLWPN